MCLTGSLKWVNSHSKRQCKSIFRKVRKAMKGKKWTKKQQPSFQYDPSSYALNFDDGCCHLSGGGGSGGAFQVKPDIDQLGNNAIFVYVVWLKDLEYELMLVLFKNRTSAYEFSA